MLERTRKLWKRRVQGRLFEFGGFQSFLDEREKDALEDQMGFRGQWDEHRRYQIDELLRLGLEPSSTVLEIGCGPLTAGIPIIEYLDSGNYVGVDVRSNVLDMAWSQIGKLQLAVKNPRLICTNEFGTRELSGQKFDFVWSFSVLYHLSDDILDRYFSTVAKRIGGAAFANVQTNVESSTWLQFPFLKRSVDTYRSLAARHGLETTELGTLEERGFRLSGAEKDNRLLMFKHAA